MTGLNSTSPTHADARPPSLAQSIPLAVAMFSLSLLTVLGNAVVIYALRTNRHLRTVRLFLFAEVKGIELCKTC